ncbi:hypothetical protein OAS19_01940 [Altererythrobacter sp.]|nr:hypothetical protein [Altererythrobacter sp.]
MIGKMIGALVGGKLAQQSKTLGGPAGAAIGVAVPIVLRRMSLPAMAALGVGGYFVKKYMDKQDKSANRETLTPAEPVAAPVTQLEQAPPKLTAV